MGKVVSEHRVQSQGIADQIVRRRGRRTLTGNHGTGGTRPDVRRYYLTRLVVRAGGDRVVVHVRECGGHDTFLGFRKRSSSSRGTILAKTSSFSSRFAFSSACCKAGGSEPAVSDVIRLSNFTTRPCAGTPRI